MSTLTLLMLLSAAPAMTSLSSGAPPLKKTVLTINFTAVDSHGEMIPDLHREDLRVSDAGENRNVVFVRRIGAEPWDPPTLGSGEVSNRIGSFAPYTTIVLLDSFNEDFAAQASATAELIHDLQGASNAGSLFLYLLNVDGQLVPIHGIPFELHFHPGSPSIEPPWTAHIKALLDDALAKSLGPQRPTITLSEHANLTFRTLDSLAVPLSRIPGRKNMVWLNNGEPNGVALSSGPSRGASLPLSYSHELNILSQRLNAFGVALYALNRFSSSNSFLNATAAGIMDELVANTGGRFNEGSDMGVLIEQALRDARTSYELGYEEPLESLNGKLHKLRVSTNRKNVRIQTQSTYIATSETANTDFTQMINSASIPAFDAAEIGLRGVVTSDPVNQRTHHLQLLVNAHDLALTHESTTYTAMLRLAVVGYLASGRTTGGPVLPFELVLRHADKNHQDVLNGGIQLTQAVKLGTQITKIRVIVLDKTAKTVGTLTLPIQ